MKLSQRIQSHINFANFCDNYKLDPIQTGQLIALVIKRAKLVGKLSQIDDPKLDKQDDKLCEKIIEHAKAMKLTAVFDSLYPCLTPFGEKHPIHLPIINN